MAVGSVHKLQQQQRKQEDYLSVLVHRSEVPAHGKAPRPFSVVALGGWAERPLTFSVPVWFFPTAVYSPQSGRNTDEATLGGNRWGECRSAVAGAESRRSRLGR